MEKNTFIQWKKIAHMHLLNRGRTDIQKNFDRHLSLEGGTDIQLKFDGHFEFSRHTHKQRKPHVEVVSHLKTGRKDREGFD